jgi:hypothetical protein
LFEALGYQSMSSLWTPDGERSLDEPTAEHDDSPVSEAEIAAQLEQLRADLAATPVEVLVANHAYGLFELAALHLSSSPPRLPEARLAIDALGGMLAAVEGRLGEAEGSLAEAIDQIRLAFVQISGVAGSPGATRSVVDQGSAPAAPGSPE